MSLFHPVSTSNKPKLQGFPYLHVQVSPSQKPAAKSFSIVDVQTLGLMLMILMVVSMPIYRSVLESQGKQTSSPVAAAHSGPIKTARATGAGGEEKNTNAEQEGRKKGKQEKREEKKERNPF